MDKANKKVRDITFQANINMDRRNQVYINIVEMFIKANLQMGTLVVKVSSLRLKDNIQEILKMVSSMAMENLNG
mgnify:FL=1